MAATPLGPATGAAADNPALSVVIATGRDRGRGVLAIEGGRDEGRARETVAGALESGNDAGRGMGYDGGAVDAPPSLPA